MTPAHAAFYTLLLPGSAHFSLGRPVRALCACLSSFGLLFLGWAILRERIFFHELFEGFGPFALVPIQLIPESCNIGGVTLLNLLHPGDSVEAARQIRTHLPVGQETLEHVALFLSGTGGIAAVLWASDAAWLARARKSVVSPAAVALYSWLVPGLGHARLGQRDKGLVMGGSIFLLFAMGLLVSGGAGCDRITESVWWTGQHFFGGGTLFAALVTAPMRVTGVFPDYHELGKILCIVAGLMNIVVMIDAWSIAAGDLEQVPQAREGV